MGSAAAFTLAPFGPAHVADAFALWRASEGIGLAGETPEIVAACLARSPGLSFVALREGRVVGAVLCTSDGRRGYLHHLAVEPECRRLGIGRALAEAGAAAMAAQGLPKVHLFVWRTNEPALRFWARIGWAERDDLVMMSRTLARGSAG